MNIPKEAKKVFSGIIFEVYQWKQKMYDGSYKTFEIVYRGPSVEVLAVVKNKIIILEEQQPRKPSYLSLSGGRVEKNETPLAAAKRELLDETGYQAKEMSLLQESFGFSKMSYHLSVFLAKDCRKISKPHPDNGEKIKFTLVSFEDFLQLARNKRFSAQVDLKFMMYEALLDKKKKQEFKKKLFG